MTDFQPPLTARGLLGLGNVDNTSDDSKPISTPQAAVLTPLVASERKGSAAAKATASAADQAATSRPRNLFENSEFGYILKADGTVAAAGATTAWKCTEFLSVTADTKVMLDSDTAISGGSSAAAIAFYSATFAFLGFANQADKYNEYTVSSLYPTAKYVRITFLIGSHNTAYLKRPGIYTAARRELGYLPGMVAIDPKGATGQYVARSNGAIVSQSSYSVSDFIAVNAATVLVRSAAYLTPTSAVAPVAFYDAAQAYLGAYSPLDAMERFVVGDLYPTAKFVRFCWVSVDHLTKQFYRADSLSAGAIDQVVSALQVDLFLQGGLSNGWIGAGGVFNSAGSWRTTPLIKAKPGQKFVFSCDVVGSSGVGHVTAWDAAGAFISAPIFGDGVVKKHTDTIVTMPAGTAYIRGSFPTTAVVATLMGALVTDGGAAASTIAAMVPAEAYALQGEPLYLYSRGIVCDPSLDVSWNISGANDEVCIITPASTSDVTVALQARGPSNGATEIGTFKVKVTGTPVNPAAPRNVICIGDSLTLGVSQANIQGAYVNELCRRLTGTGTALLAGAQSPAPLALSNFKFRGTEGDQPIKHEGRGGWTANQYMTQANGNSFWNPSTAAFDFNYYLTNNGFDVGSVADGVNATGSNLTVIILLGWNDVYNDGATVSAANLALLIDRIKAARSATDFILVGLNPAPKVNHKTYTGVRYVSQREIFELAVRQFGIAYRTMAATKINTDFLQISHVFNAEIGYETDTRLLNGRTAQTQLGCKDHVHPNGLGYAMLADAVFYKLLYKYCR